MRTKGKITSWNDQKGFGFITPSTGGKQIFVHIKAFINRDRRPEINQLVTYTSSFDRQGRPCATNATRAGDHVPERAKPSNKSAFASTKTKRSNASAIAAIFFLAMVFVAVVTSKISPLILAVYIIASLVTFMTYHIDKTAAKKGTWRTSEKTLHLLSLAGGWPGALVAQQELRHKSKKQSFRSVFWVTVFLNCCVFVFLLTPTGADIINTLLNS